jgi:hypothetical protein
MSLGNPWAWLGLIALAVPIAIHLLARRTARVQRFPTLRFLEASRPLPSRYTRLTDLPLLLIRLGIVIVAATALARPVFLPVDRSQTFDQLARAVVVDTSNSMQRIAVGGQTALAAARDRARAHAAESQVSVVMETASPADALAGAAEWLRSKSGRRELILVSDFQRGTIVDTDVNRLPQDIGIMLDRVEAVPRTGPIVVQTRTGNAIANAATTLTDDRTSVEWQVQPASSPTPSIVQLAARTDSIASAAALSAALEVTAPPSDTTRRIAVVYENYDGRAQLVKDARPIQTPWMGDVAAALEHDGIWRMATGTIHSREHMLLFTNTPPGSLASAELMLAILQALPPAAPGTELEPQTVPIELLQRWQRPTARAVDVLNQDDGASDGRWLWLLALLLLVVETAVRRSKRKVTEVIPAEPGYERVA